jgi:geranylgeranylglycerol-phosphate geranylgeranyltransferase
MTNVYSFNINLKKNIKYISNEYQSKNFNKVISLHNSIKNTENNTKSNTKKKINSFLKLIRSNNIIPTILLCLVSGWIVNPSIYNLLHSTKFIISTVNVVLIMSSSMIINDIYDIKIDKINNANRPLINGEIKLKEAFILQLFLLTICEYLTFEYLPNNLNFIINLAIISINIYTPIIKKILIIKNLFCALFISFSIFFSGLAATNELLFINKNFDLFSIIITFIFFGSLSNEIILDIRDYEGDNNNIKTIPLVFGKKIAWLFALLITNINIIINSFILYYLYNNTVALIFIIILIPNIINLYKIKKNNYSINSIKNYMEYTNKPFLFVLLYMCILAYIK